MELIDSLKKQMSEEIGDDEDMKAETRKLLLQKFGIIPPQLTPSENHLILKEERSRGR
jgi:hypothetical protein